MATCPHLNSMENEEYLTKQIITYIGNKRSLLPFIGNAVDEVKKRLGKSKLTFFETAFADNLCK